jgi:hypothetical protein
MDTLVYKYVVRKKFRIGEIVKKQDERENDL